MLIPGDSLKEREMKNYIVIILKLFVITFFITNCVTITRAKYPVIRDNLSIKEKNEIYLKYHISIKSGSYYQDSVLVDYSSLEPVMADMSPEALKVFKEGKSLNDAGMIFMNIGSAAVGWSLGKVIYYGSFDTNHIILSIGGLVSSVIGLIIGNNAGKKINASIEMYNTVFAEKLGISIEPADAYVPANSDVLYTHDPENIDQRIYLTLASYSF
jgi:hypothetical protein